MTMNKASVEATKVDNESSDAEGANYETTSCFRERILPSSLLPVDSEQRDVDDSDNDSGFVGVFQGCMDYFDSAPPEITDKTNGYRMDIEEISDRRDVTAAIFRKPANRSNLVEAWIDKDIERIKACEPTSLHAAVGMKVKDPTAECSGEKWQVPTFKGLRNELESIPDSLLHFLNGIDRSGDCARPSNQKPDWLDIEKLRKGQKFARDHMFSIYFAEILSLFVLFSFKDGLKPLIISGKSSSPYTAFKRYLSTGLRVRHWYTEDLWEKGTVAYKDILTVRAMHAAARRRLEACTNAEIDAAAKIENAWCPARDTLLKDFSDATRPCATGQYHHLLSHNEPNQPKVINQVDMAFTQWGFIGFVTSHPKYLGIHDATDEDLEAFCHLWRSIGYQLGMEDEFNFCRGTLENIRQRSVDFLETWVKPKLREISPEWEHMMRCVISGVGAFLPGLTYEMAVLHLSEMLELQIPRFYALVPYKDWIKYNLIKSLFYYTIRFPGVVGLFNTLLNWALDRAENFTAEQLEVIRIKFDGYCGSNGCTEKIGLQ